MTNHLPTIQRQTDPLLTVLRAAGRAGVPTLLWGAPGIGKSSLLHALARAEGLPMETVIASLREPSDFAGLPVIRETGVDLAPPAWAAAGRGRGRVPVSRRAHDRAAGCPGRSPARGAGPHGR